MYGQSGKLRRRTAHQEIREDCLTGSYLLNLNSQDVVSEFDSQGLQYHFQSAMFGGIAEGAVGLQNVVQSYMSALRR